jgi:nitrous oxidase accessory protein
MNRFRLARLTPRRLACLALLAATLLAGTGAAASAPAQSGSAQIIVGPGGEYTALAEALAAARPGDTIQVRGGTHPGPIVVTTPDLILEGVDWPILDGGGDGTVVTLAAPGITLRGFEVRGSGSQPDQNHGGITLSAPNILVENNRLRDVLFGIFVAQADGAVVRGNDVTGKAEYDLGRKGDGIRLWYSRSATIEGNTVHETRDVVAWYAADITLRNNVIANGRYGIHLMYCDGAVITGNTFANNSVGVYTMYSAGITLRENLVRGQRGPSGYALGFKDADNLTVTGNVLADNRAGIFLDGTPFSPQAYARFENNLLAFNDVGIILLPAVKGNVFAANALWENVEQVAVQGGGLLAANTWAGNYWSDYGGFDANGDGLGDTPYRAERFFESLMAREPLLRALLYSPAVETLEQAASAFPIVRPQPKLTDPSPLIEPLPLPAWALSPPAPRWPLAVAGLALCAAWLLLVAVSRRFRSESPMMSPLDARLVRSPDPTSPQANAPATLQVTGLSKCYGRTLALSEINFSAHAGEAIALWGANGAGKSTLLKSLLGLVDYRGQVRVAGHDVRRAGKLARRAIGYVPQEAQFYDLNVRATLAFYARLKQVPDGSRRIAALLERLGLAEHAGKPVAALSGGLRQRLALAIALLADPPVLLLDEPTASLDAGAQRDYLALLASLRSVEGKTILFASHRLEEVEALANRVLWLEQGRLSAELSPIELLTRLLPEVELTLWVPAAQRQDALSCLAGAGWDAHFNGRGTVVVRLKAEHKLRPLQALEARGIQVNDFELVRGAAWK